MKPLPITKAGDGRRQMQIHVGNVDFVATERDGLWEVVMVQPGPMASFLTEESAARMLGGLSKVVGATGRGRPPRVVCADCGKYVAVDAAGLTWMHWVRGPGEQQVACPGAHRSVSSEIPTTQQPEAK